MKIPFIDLTREWNHFESRFIDAFKEFGANGQYVLGTYTEEFETGFAAYCGYSYASTISTGLSAIETALRAYGIGEGDEVITVPNSAVATALAISSIGAKPVFCDIGEDFLIDTNKIESLITSKTKAIVPVHLFGKICNMQTINSVANKHDLVVIEDACQAHGSDFGAEVFGGEAQKNTKAFSFYPTKNLGALGEGGAVVTNDEKVKKFVDMYRNYGQEGRYNHVTTGTNYRLAPLQCVFLNIKLGELDTFIQKRRTIAERYIEKISSLDFLQVLPFDETSSYHLFVVRVRNGKRDELKAYLAQKGIDSAVHYPVAIHKQPCYKDQYIDAQLPVTDALQEELLSLPCYPFLREDELEYIVSAIESFSL